MTNWTLIAKHICEAAVWIALIGFSVHGCVQCHRASCDAQQKASKP